MQYTLFACGHFCVWISHKIYMKRQKCCVFFQEDRMKLSLPKETFWDSWKNKKLHLLCSPVPGIEQSIFYVLTY